MACMAKYQYYGELYAFDIDENTFNRLSWESERLLVSNTTGIDGYKKLKEAFPTDEYDAETVKRCFCKLVNVLYQIEQAETITAKAHGYVQREDGSMIGAVVTSISSGSESISYSAGNSASKSVIEQAAADISEKNKLLHNIIRDFLAGVADANGVNLLYMGRYPLCIKT